jgi:hypothetical protein
MPTLAELFTEESEKTGVLGFTTIVRDGVFVEPVTLVARITKVEVPTVLGVPVIAPLEVLRLIPAGKLPENTE